MARDLQFGGSGNGTVQLDTHSKQDDFLLILGVTITISDAV